MIVQIGIVVNSYSIEYNLILLMIVFLDIHILWCVLNFYAIDQGNRSFDVMIHLISNFLFDRLFKMQTINRLKGY